MAPAVLVQPVWARVSDIPIDGDLIRSAADLAERHAWRGYDAIHLAALLQAGGPAQVTFACWDGDRSPRPQTRL
jgi:predicted nucleic acid-binding protein